MNDIRQWAERFERSVLTAFRGRSGIVETMAVALLCRGHVLIEDVPGVGKTVLARAVARSIGGRFTQVQCTPDLLPADVLGVSVFNQATGAFTFREGPVVTNVLLVDEISRATPRTQSALLEAMAEGQVSIEGRSMPLPDPFLMIATESPVEAEGTFPLPEVQKDRFFLTLSLGYPDAETERELMLALRQRVHPLERIEPVASLAELRNMQERVVGVHVEPGLRHYLVELVRATRTDPRLLLGVSPRGSLALYKGAQALAAVRGREYVVPEDIHEIAEPVLRKRVLLRPEAAAKGITEDGVIRELLGSMPVPPLAQAV
ncbi:MAG: MoxR family ATPase [Spirochaetes bacterium]|nr:MoxR family ATPase [Spirochaetota bacterium]